MNRTSNEDKKLKFNIECYARNKHLSSFKIEYDFFWGGGVQEQILANYLEKHYCKMSTKNY